jgi:acetylornithine deacetylase
MQIDLFYGSPTGKKIEDLKAFIEYYILKTAESDPWLKGNPPEVEWFGWKCEPSETHPDHPLVNMMRRHLREIVGIAPPLRARAPNCGCPVSDIRPVLVSTPNV